MGGKTISKLKRRATAFEIENAGAIEGVERKVTRAPALACLLFSLEVLKRTSQIVRPHCSQNNQLLSSPAVCGKKDGAGGAGQGGAG